MEDDTAAAARRLEQGTAGARGNSRSAPETNSRREESLERWIEAELERQGDLFPVKALPPQQALDATAIPSDTAETRPDQVIDAALLGDSEAVERGLIWLKEAGGSAAGLGTQALRRLLTLQAHAYQRGSVKGWPPDALARARRRMNAAILATRQVPNLEASIISEAFHAIAFEARRQRHRAGDPR